MEYKSRQFCKDIECGIQIRLDNGPDDEVSRICKEYCKGCMANKFHKYLKENGYKIVKGGDDLVQ
jgi:hypothetical protein